MNSRQRVAPLRRCPVGRGVTTSLIEEMDDAEKELMGIFWVIMWHHYTEAGHANLIKSVLFRIARAYVPVTPGFSQLPEDLRALKTLSCAPYLKAGREGIPVHFLHFSLFSDAFSRFGHCRASLTALTATDAEFPDPQRSNRTWHALFPDSILAVERLDQLGLNTWAKILQGDLALLAEGLRMWSHAHGGEVLLIGVPYGVLGNSPSHTQFAGFKSSSNWVAHLCHLCTTQESCTKALLHTCTHTAHDQRFKCQKLRSDQECTPHVVSLLNTSGNPVAAAEIDIAAALAISEWPSLALYDLVFVDRQHSERPTAASASRAMRPTGGLPSGRYSTVGAARNAPPTTSRFPPCKHSITGACIPTQWVVRLSPLAMRPAHFDPHPLYPPRYAVKMSEIAYDYQALRIGWYLRVTFFEGDWAIFTICSFAYTVEPMTCSIPASHLVGNMERTHAMGFVHMLGVEVEKENDHLTMCESVLYRLAQHTQIRGKEGTGRLQKDIS
ncbi:hypothetical protein BDK51DRAFT_38251 [Blyttiomyces helicus]|uniref:Uncharacterized protein n=1 Tax=Blyttiomyces helicus TaxID=388810 RepID=A0A4P9WKP4_9FUNG|nr:hypothetical protein BDK51DRAFT_38251 [Blyttiomyces helicus]|eukprot:RKO92972.1 hypothetical protein BDK51DRAFT_38251 [Blyttiomyces helicus]